jgi:hypothetical protein
VLPYLFEHVEETERRQMALAYEKYRDIALDLETHHPHAV